MAQSHRRVLSKDRGPGQLCALQEIPNLVSTKTSLKPELTQRVEANQARRKVLQRPVAEECHRLGSTEEQQGGHNDFSKGPRQSGAA